MSGNCRYVKQKKQVSYDGGLNWTDTGDYRKGSFIDTDSPQCGYDVVYRWVNIDKTVDYYCQGTDKYYKQKKQVSYDGGTTYADVSPAEYRQGGIAERNSVDCGYVAKNYFKFKALENGRFKAYAGTYYNLKYSIDSGTTWTSIAGINYTDNVAAGNEIWWKGNYYGNGPIFQSTGRFEAEGNVMSLVYEDDFEDKTDLSKCRLANLFSGCTGLTSAENLVLPATTINTWMAYSNMFQDCTSLTTPPSILPSTTLGEKCYIQMFFNCTSLTSAPELPATALTEGCYAEMFSGCTSLATAPELPATTLTEHCYLRMFENCTSLNYVKCLATDISAHQCTGGWLLNTSATGTFVKNASMSDWPSGTSGIPEGWTVQNA